MWIARWVTSHGFALNVNTNLDHFRLITPCGLQGTGVTSIAKMIGREVPLEDVRAIVASKFAEVYEREMVPRSLANILGWNVTLKHACSRLRCSKCQARSFKVEIAFDRKPRGWKANPS